MAPPEQTEQEPEKVPLRTVSAAADGPEDGAAKADGAPSADQQQQRPAGGVSLWLSKPRVMWWIAVLVAIVLVAVVLVATLLSTGRETDDMVWTDDASLLTVWPRPRGKHRMIWFRHGSLPHEGREWPELTAQLKELVTAYDPVRASRNANVTECFGRRPEHGKVCLFDIRAVAPECTAALDFGYKEGNPCVFLQFSNVPGWEPAPLPQHEAAQLLPAPLLPLLKPGLVLLQCEGDTIVDRENLGGVVYTPYQGFRTEFFPYTGHRDYMAPLVAVQFRKPSTAVVIGVRCRLWVRNPPPANASAELFFNLLVD
ncbi:sodium/potassium-transporting ATPase subunit beta-2-like [Amblyomma americanum]